MYELIHTPGEERPLAIIKHTPQEVFTLKAEDEKMALEILEALNNPGLDDAA